MATNPYLSIGTRSIKDIVDGLSGMPDMDGSPGVTGVGFCILERALHEYGKFIGLYEWSPDNNLKRLGERKSKKVMNNILEEPLFFGRLHLPETYTEFNRMTTSMSTKPRQAIVQIDYPDKEYKLIGNISHNAGFTNEWVINDVEWEFREGSYILQKEPLLNRIVRD